MARQQLQVYEINALGPEGEVLAPRYLSYPLSEEFDAHIDKNDEREVHFQALQQALGASGYEARLMQPREVKKLIRKMWREEAIDQFAHRAAKLTGLDNMIELLPVMAEFTQPVSDPLHEGIA